MKVTPAKLRANSVTQLAPILSGRGGFTRIILLSNHTTKFDQIPSNIGVDYRPGPFCRRT